MFIKKETSNIIVAYFLIKITELHEEIVISLPPQKNKLLWFHHMHTYSNFNWKAL